MRFETTGQHAMKRNYLKDRCGCSVEFGFLAQSITCSKTDGYSVRIQSRGVTVSVPLPAGRLRSGVLDPKSRLESLDNSLLTAVLETVQICPAVSGRLRHGDGQSLVGHPVTKTATFAKCQSTMHDGNLGLSCFGNDSDDRREAMAVGLFLRVDLFLPRERWRVFVALWGGYTGWWALRERAMGKVPLYLLCGMRYV